MIIFLIFLFYWLGVSLHYAYILLGIITLVILIIVFKKYKTKLLFVCLATFIAGVGVSHIRIDQRHQIYEGIVIEAKSNYFLLYSGGERLYTYEKNNNYEIGDVLKIKGYKEELSFTVIESQFDFEAYLNRKGVYYELKAQKIEITFCNFIRIKKQRNQFLNKFDQESQSLISLIMFSSGEESPSKLALENLHLGRLASNSGVYIYAYISFISWALSFLIKKKWARLAALGTLLPYFIFTFPKLSIIRLLFLEVLRWINQNVLKNKFSSFSLLGITGLIFLLFDYHLGAQDSFILGFSIGPVISFINQATFMQKGIKKKIINTLFIYLFFIPFECKYYNGYNPLSLLLQTLLTPLFILLGIVSLICFYKIPIYGLANWYVKGLSNLLGWINKCSFQINAPNFSDWLVVVYYFLFLVIIYYQSIEFKPIYKPLKFCLLGLILLYSLPINNLVTASVSFINVGQGDCCLIRRGTTTVMIDTGGSLYTDIANESLIPYLRKQRIYNIDLLITTHDDYDHSGAVNSLKENFHVKKYITNWEQFPLKINGITFTNYNNHIDEYNESNESSLVIGFSLLNKDFLIMGDASIANEKQIISEYTKIDCDVLKVGHHGSDTSTCQEFINFLKPKEAIISVGRNYYGHPTNKVLSILKNSGVIIKRTDELGTITYRNYISM